MLSRFVTIPRLLTVIAVILIISAVYHVYKPLPAGLNLTAPQRYAADIEFLTDNTYTDADGERQIEQQIFDAILAMIADARQFVLVDMFLFNEFQGDLTDTHRALSTELTQALIAQKHRYPELDVQVISDSLNTVYGGLSSPHFTQLEAAGITVTLTNLSRLRDSNPVYSAIWRPFVQPFGNSDSHTLPNPFGEGRVSVRSYLALLNFKANHRKLIIADNAGELRALVTSANPHDGSSEHSNVALRFNGEAVRDLLGSEAAVLNFSGRALIDNQAQRQALQTESLGNEGLTVQVVTERAVEQSLLTLINDSDGEETLDVAVFYLSDRHIVRALSEAAKRGVQVRVLLDPNKDAFGREKNGVPNRPVAHELMQAGVAVRWCDTQGEQCHSKWMLHSGSDGNSTMVLGSTNFTRRNLHNLNLETSVVVRGPAEAEPLEQGREWFNDQWYNRDGRQFSVDYDVYADESLWHRVLYRVMEATGISTF